MSYRILIADDEEEILEILELYLQKDGYSVVKACNGMEAINIILKEKIDLAIIDVMMPIIDGFKLIKKIRESENIPVLFLSAKDQDRDKILGLGLGADDYITKPFNPLEVVARVEAQLRRYYNLNPRYTEKESINIGDLELDLYNHSLKKYGKEIVLTSVEYKIISFLMRNSGRVLTKKEIFENVWQDYFTGDDNTIMVHISNLRDKVEEDSRAPMYLKTIRGLGYKFENQVRKNE